MKITIYTRIPVTSPGGVETFVRTLHQQLQQRGHDSEIIDAAYLGCSLSLPIPRVARIMAEDWKKRRQSRDIGLFNGECGMYAPRGRMVNVFHGTYTGRSLAYFWLRPLKSFLATFLLAGYQHWRAGVRNHCVAVSSSCARQLAWLNLLPGATVIQNGIDPQHFSPGDRTQARGELGFPQDKRIYFYASRVEVNKYPHFPSIWRDHLNADEMLVTATDQDLKLGSKVLSLVNVPHAQMLPLYRAADVFLMPTAYEGCSYALIEAMSCGTIPVCSPVGHAQDIIQAKPQLRACFQPKYSAMAFLQRARELLAEPEQIQLWRQLAREYVLEHNTAEIMASQYEALFAQILQEDK